jgi:DNA-binding transcriptional LysR family regulator
VSARIGVALVPASIQLLPIPGVVYRPLAGPQGKAQIAVVHREDEHSPLVEAFREVAVEVIAKGVSGLQRLRHR